MIPGPAVPKGPHSFAHSSDHVDHDINQSCPILRDVVVPCSSSLLRKQRVSEFNMMGRLSKRWPTCFVLFLSSCQSRKPSLSWLYTAHPFCWEYVLGSKEKIFLSLTWNWLQYHSQGSWEGARRWEGARLAPSWSVIWCADVSRRISHGDLPPRLIYLAMYLEVLDINEQPLQACKDPVYRWGYRQHSSWWRDWAGGHEVEGSPSRCNQVRSVGWHGSTLGPRFVIVWYCL